MFLLDLNSGDERPIYGQIADRVKFAVAGGVLRAGDLVPSVRELSKQLVVNPNTVARAYRDLQVEGLLESVRGMGLEVAEGAAERCRAARGRSSGCGCGGRSRKPGRARWTRPRSRPSSAKSGPGARVKPTAMSETQDQQKGTRHDSGTDPVANRGGDPGSGVDQAVQEPDGRRRAIAVGTRGLDLRPARRERSGQDHDDPDVARPGQTQWRPNGCARTRPGTPGASTCAGGSVTCRRSRCFTTG